MPKAILKADRGRDLYVEWSTVVDDVIGYGTRAQMLAYLTGLASPAAWIPGKAPEDRLRRADETGTTALWPSPADPFGGFDGVSLMVRAGVDEHQGYLRRADLAAYVDAIDRDDEPAAVALLIPVDEAPDVLDLDLDPPESDPARGGADHAPDS